MYCFIMLSFVVHEHHARRLHYDFRLEMEGILKSWAIPKCPSMNPADKRLAVMVEDHALEYGSFEGEIPEGSYGAGKVIIWDKGSYDLISGNIKSGRMEFLLKGKKLKGIFVFLKFKGKDKEWLLIKKKDKFADESFKIRNVLTG